MIIFAFLGAGRDVCLFPKVFPLRNPHGVFSITMKPYLSLCPNCKSHNLPQYVYLIITFHGKIHTIFNRRNNKFIIHTPVVEYRMRAVLLNLSSLLFLKTSFSDNLSHSSLFWIKVVVNQKYTVLSKGQLI